MSFNCKLRISHHSMKQELHKFRIKWCLSSYFSLPAKLLLIQSGIFGPIRAPPGRFDNIDPKGDTLQRTHAHPTSVNPGTTTEHYINSPGAQEGQTQTASQSRGNTHPPITPHPSRYKTRHHPEPRINSAISQDGLLQTPSQSMDGTHPSPHPPTSR